MLDQALAPPTLRTGTTVQERLASRLEQSMADEEARGRRLAARGRTFALAAVAVLVLLIAPFPDVIYYETLLGVFVLLGWIRVWLENRGLYRWWHGYFLTALDFSILAFTLIGPNPLAATDFPPQMALRYGNFIYFFVLLSGLAVSYQPRQVLFGGVVGALTWSIATVWIVSLPDTVLMPAGDVTFHSMLAAHALPNLVDLNIPFRDVSVFLIVATLLALIVRRSRSLVVRQATLERERGNLARYFPPATVDRLARQDTALAQVREQQAAVLFADLVGFTHWAERHSPSEVITLLRDVHAQLEVAVFRHHGTLDKFIGDGMMATFGTPDPGPLDATNALACVKDVVSGFSTWAERRRQSGRAPIRISLGLHYGPVVVGNIGTDRRLELAVLGDTVNVASRLEGLTRELACMAVISAAVAEQVGREADGGAETILTGFALRGSQSLKGRDETVTVLTYG